MKQNSMVRVFVAWELPKASTLRLLEWQDRLIAHFGNDRFRPIPAANLHLTALFVGPASPDWIKAIHQAISGPSVPTGPGTSLMVNCSHVDAFPSRSNSRILVARLSDPDGGLSGLQRQLAAALATSNVVFDNRPFVPHVTLAKLATGATAPIERDWDRLEAEIPFGISLEYLPVLFSSRNGPHGVEYQKLSAGSA